MITENRNLGVIFKPIEAQEYICGVNSPLIPNEINISGDNRPYKPDQEKQSGTGGDKMDCVTVSSAGSIETNLNMLIATKQITVGHLLWLKKLGFIGPDGIVRISTRWAAIQNGTTLQGNDGQTVAEWWRNNGFIPESMLPNDQSLTWSQYYDKGCITDSMKAVATESLKYFTIQHEWILPGDDRLRAALKRGAIQNFTAVCPGWNNGNTTPIPACNLPLQHATETLFVEDNGVKNIWDSYDPFNKQFAADYPIPYKKLYIVNQNIIDNDMVFKKEKDKANIYLINEVAKTKILIIDMPTLTAISDGQFEEVDSLADYQDKGTLVWTSRLIN